MHFGTADLPLPKSMPRIIQLARLLVIIVIELFIIEGWWEFLHGQGFCSVPSTVVFEYLTTYCFLVLCFNPNGVLLDLDEGARIMKER